MINHFYDSDVTTCLQVNIHVPARAISNGTAHLECNYELENENQLDFVRVLKDEKLFYHFTPEENDQISSVNGINANVSAFLFPILINSYLL